MTLSELLESFEFSILFSTTTFLYAVTSFLHLLQKYVCDVYLSLTLLRCGIAFLNVGYVNVKHRIVLCLLSPFLIAVNVLACCPFPSNHDQGSPTVSNRVQQIYYLGDVGENFRFRKEQRCWFVAKVHSKWLNNAYFRLLQTKREPWLNDSHSINYCKF